MKALGLLGFAQAAGQLVSGYSGCLVAVTRRQCHLVILAADAGVATKRKFVQAARGIPVINMGTKAGLGKAVGKSDRAVLCVRDRRMAQAILETADSTAMEADGNHGKLKQDHS